MNHCLATVCGALVLVANAAFAGPFGIEMGAGIENYEVKEPGPKPMLLSVPKPHPLFEHYAVWHSTATGICRVIGISEPFRNDRYGEELRTQFGRVRAALDAKYGNSETIDMLKPGALWTEPDDWVMAIRQNERMFGAYWPDPDPVQSDDLGYIELVVSTLSSDTAYMVLRYDTTTFEDCERAIAERQESAF